MTDETNAASKDHGLLGRLASLLRGSLLVAEAPPPGLAARLVVAAAIGFALHGAASGFFQGGSQILVTAIKAPLIALGSVALCLPSLFVWSSLAGADRSGRWFLAVAAGSVAVLALLQVGFLPIIWLFSVSSRTLVFPVLLHVACWMIALHFAQRFLTRAFEGSPATRVLFPWTLMVLVVSFQLATVLQPVLSRESGEGLWTFERTFFLERFFEILGGKP